MERYGVSYRNANKRVFSVSRAPCRQFISGSCRYGPSCHFSHEFPVLPSVPTCRYFQKGVCWYGDRCRYQHVLSPAAGASGSRRGSAPALHPPAWGGRVVAARRGSEPSMAQLPGTYVRGRRGSEPLVTNLTSLQHNFEPLTMDITEEEEHGVGEPAPRLQLQHDAWSRSQRRGDRGPQRVVPPECHRVTPSTASTHQHLVARAGPITTAKDKPWGSGAAGRSLEASGQQVAGRSGEGGAAAALGRAQSEEAYEQSKDVACGICMDKVYEKPNAQERRFGILPNCSHAFCLGCIVTWRKTKDFQEEVIKACPQCRVKSTYYIPSKYWVSDGEPKQTLITTFKEKTSKIRCNFFMTHGCCPFKSECIYRHELPNGYRPRRRRSSPMPYTGTLEELDGDSLQLLHYVIALTLLDDDDELLDEDDFFQLYLDNEYDPL